MRARSLVLCWHEQIHCYSNIDEVHSKYDRGQLPYYYWQCKKHKQTERTSKYVNPIYLEDFHPSVVQFNQLLNH